MSKGKQVLGDPIKIPKAVLIEIEKLIPHPQNLKDHPKSQVETLTKLIKLVGFKDPIVIDKKLNVKAGHGRLLAAKKLEMKKVPCIYIENMTKKQMDLFMYLDNYVNESPWIVDNIELIFDEMPQMELEEWPEINWDKIISAGEIDEGPIPGPPKKPKTKLGDIYQLGNHRVMCGSSTNPEDMMKLCTSNCTIGFTSPPYNLGKNSKVTNPNEESKYIGYDDDNPDYLKLLIDFTDLALSLNKYVFVNIQQLSGNKIQFIDYLHHFKSNFVDIIIWDKKSSAPALAKNVLNSEFEYILIFSPKKNASRSINTNPFHGTIQNIYHAPLNHNNEFADIHRAVFPIHLPQYIINNFSKKNDIILDSFLGTGTSLIAAEDSNRICYGMEIDPAYVDVCVERWENFTKKKAKLVN